MVEIPKLQIKLNNKHDIELYEFAASMASLSDEYYRFIRQNNAQKLRNSYKLYVKKIAEGSIILELCENAPALLPGITPLLVEYASFIIQTLDYLTGQESALPSFFKYLKEDFLNFKKFLEPIANCNGNTLSVIGINFGTVIVNRDYSHTEASAAQNKCDKEIKNLERSGESLIKEKVELRLYQARDSNLSVSMQGNMGIINEVCDKPKVLVFANDRLRYDITKAENNPFNFTYNVDVEIKLKEGSIFLESHKDVKEYEILKLHGIIRNEDLFNSH